MATKTGSVLWLALAGGHHRETAVISKAEVIAQSTPIWRYREFKYALESWR
jgi:hypothetical protein